jgi:dephospho-CoA kinase
VPPREPSAALSIGLTGGIGSGKSTVAAMLAALGAQVIDADKVGHDVYRPGSEGFRRVREAFGEGVVGPDGAIDASARRAGVRRSGRVGPLECPPPSVDRGGVRERWPARAARPDVPVVSGGIMLEAGWRYSSHLGVLSVARRPWRASRPRGLRPDEVERRIDAQLPNAERRRHADVVLENDGTLDALRAQVDAAWRALPSAGR